MSDPGQDERTEPVPRTTPAELVAGEILLRPWPVRLGPAGLDVLRDQEAARERLEEDRRQLEQERGRLEEAREMARREGFARGLEEAQAQAVSRLDELVLRHGQELAKSRAELVRRVPVIASRLAAAALGRELTLDPVAWRDWLLRLIDQLHPAARITVLHHPQDGPRLSGLLRHARESREGLELAARPDESLPPGEVVLETPSVRLDARLSTLAATWERELEQVFDEPGSR
jgi:flagellar biosynthesis/type III secretory pathway protein FliH